jgi:hypothetical protein
VSAQAFAHGQHTSLFLVISAGNSRVAISLPVTLNIYPCISSAATETDWPQNHPRKMQLLTEAVVIIVTVKFAK